MLARVLFSVVVFALLAASVRGDEKQPSLEELEKQLISKENDVRQKAYAIWTRGILQPNGSMFKYSLTISDMVKRHPDMAGELIFGYAQVCKGFKAGNIVMKHAFRESREAVAPVLVKELESDNVNTVAIALYALPELLDKESQAVEEVLKKGSAKARARAAAVLGDGYVRTAVGILKEALKDSDVTVRAAAALALLQLQSPPDEVSTKHLADDYAGLDLQQKRKVLAYLNPPRPTYRVTGPFLKKVIEDTDQELQIRAALLAAELHTEPAKVVVPHLLVGMEKAYTSEARRCVSAIADFGPEAKTAQEALEVWVKKSTDPVDQAIAAVALLRLEVGKIEDLLPFVERGFGGKAKYSEYRQILFKHLAYLGPKVSALAPTLLELLDNKVNLHTATAAVALLCIEPKHSEVCLNVLREVLQRRRSSHDNYDDWPLLGKKIEPLMTDIYAAFDKSEGTDVECAIGLLRVSNSDTKATIAELKARRDAAKNEMTKATLQRALTALSQK